MEQKKIYRKRGKNETKIPGEEEYEKAVSLINSGHFEESIPLFRISANLNYPPSFLWLYYLLNKNEKQKWKLKAETNFNWYQSKAQDGKSDSLFNLGICYQYGIGTKIDLEKAIELYNQAAEQGLACAQFNLGTYYVKKEVPKDTYSKGIKLITKAAKQGFASAQYFLGQLPYNDKSFMWYKKAAKQGHALAQFTIARHYYYGEGFFKNRKAAKWYIKAAEGGHPEAQYSLGICYRRGEGVPKDTKKAIEWYTKAAEQGIAEAQQNLGKYYESGTEVPKDIKRATELYIKAAAKGNYSAELNLENIEAKLIADVLKVDDTSKTLKLSRKFGDSEADLIADALKENKTLTELFLNLNGDLGVQAIANSLKVNSTLTKLRLYSNTIGVQAIINALRVNKTITHLDLSWNNVGGLGALAIADVLRVNNSLTELILKHTHIGNSGAQAIADALKIKSIEDFCSNNELQNLKIKNALLKLDLSENEIGSEGLDAIVEMLKVNNSLQELDLFHNNFTYVYELEKALQCNRSLTLLKVDANINVKISIEVFKFNISLQTEIPRSKSGPRNEKWRFCKRNEKIQTTLSERIFKCKNTHLSLLDYKILERVNVAVIFKNVWKLQQTQQTGKTYEECLREYWELISLNTFSKYFLFILGICKLNQILPSRSHLLGIPNEILTHIGSFLNPNDFPSDSKTVLNGIYRSLGSWLINAEKNLEDLKAII